MLEKVFKGVNVLQQFGFWGQNVGILENVIADAKIFGYPAEIFQLQWFSFAGEVIEGPGALGFEDSFFRDTPKKTQAELLSTTDGCSISSGGLTFRNIKKNVMSLR